MAGPNDYHVVDPQNPDKGLAPGLGKDEPSEASKDALRTKSAERLAALKAEIAAQGDQVDAKDRAVTEREREAEKRERELEAREREIEKKEREAAKRKHEQHS